eukprot:124116_1
MFLTALYMIWCLTITLNAQCNVNCAECSDYAACNSSSAAGLCAYSSESGCISRESTPFRVVNSNEVTCTAADAECQGIGGRLASIRNAQENEWALSICDRSGKNGDCHIGLFSTASGQE